jgi:hypothetical protein
MKKLLLVPLIVLMSGCSVLDAYLMTHYDPNEYQLITNIRAEAQQYKTQCEDAVISKSNATKLAYDTQVFVLFSEHVPRNDDVIKSSKDLQAIAQGLADQYVKSDKVSTPFCKIKFENIEKSANTMQAVIARRPR